MQRREQMTEQERNQKLKQIIGILGLNCDDRLIIRHAYWIEDKPIIIKQINEKTELKIEIGTNRHDVLFRIYSWQSPKPDTVMGPWLLSQLRNLAKDNDSGKLVNRERGRRVKSYEGHVFDYAFDNLDWEHPEQWGPIIKGWFERFLKALCCNIEGNPRQYYSEHREEVDNYVKRIIGQTTVSCS